LQGELELYVRENNAASDADDIIIHCPMQVTTLESSGDVGNRPGALHDGGLRKSGKWQEVPLFTNCTIQREYTDSRLNHNSEINI